MRPTTRTLLPAALLLGAVTLAACGGDSGAGSTHSSGQGHQMADMDHGTATTSPMPGMEGMDGMPPGGDGLAATLSGYTLTVTREPMAGMAMPITVTITRAGRPVTRFTSEQTKRMHLYLIRSDLTGFEHLHPTMDAEGNWSTESVRVRPGTYRLYTQITPDQLSDPIVLSRPLSVAGSGDRQAQPPLSPGAGGHATGTGDGYAVTVDGTARAGTATELRLGITRDGRPVTDLQPYLDTYAHVTAVHAGDLAFAHLHPQEAATAGVAPSTLRLHADLPRPGAYRLFVQFQTAGTLHTVPLTISAG